jgi:CheY-like chemotaxis protein
VSSTPLANLRILAVEDHADTRIALKIFLERFGANVTAVESGAAALATIRREKPDLLLCDLSMPQMDGYQLLERIRQREPEIGFIPAIACTAFVSTEEAARTRRAGFQAYVAKPMDLTALVATIVKCFDGPKPRAD